MKMFFGKRFRDLKHLVILILIAFFFLFYFINDSTKSKTARLHYLRDINEDIKQTYLRFYSFERLVNKMANLQTKERSAKRLKKLIIDDETSAKCPTVPFLLIEIHSHPRNFLSRQAIRLSWGNKDLDIKRNYKIVFLLGKVKNQKIQQMVQQEAHKTNDIVQGGFLDIYRNLYKKMVLSLKWPLENCPSKYILKTDEDCYVNTDLLISYLEKYDAKSGSEPLYMGSKSVNVTVERDPSNRYYVPKHLHPSPTYVPYVSGGGYVFSGILLKKLYEASNLSPLFPVEDACFGSLMNAIGVRPTNNLSFLPFINCNFLDEIKDPLERPVCEFLGPIVIHGLKPLKQIEMNFNVKLMSHIRTLCQPTEKKYWLKAKKICDGY